MITKLDSKCPIKGMIEKIQTIHNKTKQTHEKLQNTPADKLSNNGSNRNNNKFGIMEFK